MKTVDARGYNCPQPVIMTKKALGKDDEVDVLVDNRAALENVRRYARAMGKNVEELTEEEGWRLQIRK